MGDVPKTKALAWIGSSKKDLKEFPAEVKSAMGYALYQEMNKKVRDARAKKATRVNAEKVERSSGNVFADLGFNDADERLWKAQLALEISQLIESKGWTQAQTAERVGLDQPKISLLRRGRLSGFSADRLFAILNRLGHNVEVRISAKEGSPEHTHTRVMIAE